MVDTAVAGPSHATAEAPLRIRWFGGFAASWRGVPVTRLEASPQAQALLLHVVLAAGEAIGRAELAASLWPDVTDSHARANLRQLLARCRTLVPTFSALVGVTSTSMAWRTDAPAGVDVLAFVTAVRAADKARALGDGEAVRAALATAVRAYGGELDVGLAYGPLERARTRLHGTAVRVLEELLDLHAHAGRVRDAIHVGMRLLELEPLDEATCRRLMTLHADGGHPRRGLALFDRLRQRLDEEVGADPSEDTCRIAARLQARAGTADRKVVPSAVRRARQTVADPPLPCSETHDAVLEAAVVLGRDASVALVADVAGLARRAVADAIDDLVLRGLLRIGDGGRIELARAAARETEARLSPARRAYLHGEAADALARGPARRRLHDAAVAEHLERAGRVVEAADAFRRTAERAMTLGSYETAEAAFERGLRLAGARPDAAGAAALPRAEPALLASLWTGLGSCHARRLDGAAARNAFREAARWVDGDSVRLASLASHRAETYVSERALEDAIEELDVAETLLGSARRRNGAWHRAAIDVAALRARMLYLQPAATEASVDALLARLDADVARHGTLAQRLEADGAALRFALRRERYRLTPATLARAERAARIAEATGDTVTAADGRFGAAFATLFARGPEPAIPLLREALAQAERCGHRLLTVQGRAYLSLALRLAQRPDAVRAAQDVLEASVDDATPLYGGLAAAQRSWLAFVDGDAATARVAGERAVALWGSRYYPFRWSALLVLVAVVDAPDVAGRWAEFMLAEDQHELPETLADALRELRASQRSKGARSEVVAAARALGYL